MRTLGKIALTGAGIAMLGGTALGLPACKNGGIPVQNNTPESVYELALETLGSEEAEYWRGVAQNYNSEQAINELDFLPEEYRLILAEDIKGYTADGSINDRELSDLADPDRDGRNSSDEVTNGTNPMDPSNTTGSISPNTFSFVRDLVKYNGSQGNEGTLPGIYSGLERIINAVESNPEVIRNFNPQQNHILASLVSGIPEISNYPMAMRLGTIQVDSQNLGDEYAMNNFVIPAIGYIVGLQEQGRIDVLNGLGIPDQALEEEGIRQILLPIELREVNIVTGERTSANLETGIYNVTFNDALGASPQEWLGEIAARDYNDKSLPVWEWINDFPAEYGPRDIWTNSYQAYCEYLKSIDDLVLFIRDYPIYLRGPPSGNLIPGLTEQASPYYSVLLGRGFGEAVFDVVVKYPTDATGRGTHSEPFILMSNTSNSWLLPYRFGFWPEKQAFIDDYKGKPFDTPYAEVRQADGTYKKINFDMNTVQ